jgi:predicted nucleic acid-binding protein
MLIIDTNRLADVFSASPPDDVKPIRDFIYKRKGYVVSGGSTYLAEVAKVAVAVKYLAGLERNGQLRVQKASDVDAEERRVRALAPPPGCDDQHIIALVSVSRARVVASGDRRADRFLKDAALYPSGVKRPSIYREARHYRLLKPLPCM